MGRICANANIVVVESGGGGGGVDALELRFQGGERRVLISQRLNLDTPGANLKNLHIQV